MANEKRQQTAFHAGPGCPIDDGTSDLDEAATAKNLLRAVLSRRARIAPIVVASHEPARTTKDAEAMGITGVVSSYTTIYGGVANRIHNAEQAGNPPVDGEKYHRVAAAS